MRLTEQVRRLTQDNQDLKQQLQGAQKRAVLVAQEPTVAVDEERAAEEIRRNSLYFLTKIKALEG